jgi:outer membrane protein TolC
MRIVLLALTALALLCFAQDSSGPLRLADVIRSTLAAHPLLAIQKDQVQVSRAIKRQTAGLFDTQVSSSLTHGRTTTPLTTLDQLTAQQSGIVTSRQILELTTFQAGADKLFRSGIEITPTFSMVRDADNLTAISGHNLSHSGITVVLPLLRNRGYAAVGGQEIAATLEVQATQLDLSHAAAQLISIAAASYWNYLAARKNLQIAIGSEERGRSFVENVQAFIDAGKSPRSDLNEVNANLSDRIATRINAEQRMIAARAQLAYDMGLAGAQMNALGEPVTEFPKLAPAKLPADDPAAFDFYATEASQRRGDILAANRRVQESEALVTSAKNRIKPQVNLTFSAGYTGLKEGTGVGRYFQGPFTGVQGVDAVGGITYTFPPANDLAQGLLAQVEAQTRQARLRATDIQRQVRAAVLTAAEAVRHQAGRVDTAAQAVDSFQAALAGQRERYRLGMGSVVDILTMEDRLTNALINEVQAQLAYALAVNDFRFGTGTILSPNDATQTVDEQVLVTLPFDSPIPSPRSPNR